jgi:hypothetical protein
VRGSAYIHVKLYYCTKGGSNNPSNHSNIRVVVTIQVGVLDFVKFISDHHRLASAVNVYEYAVEK